MRLVHGCDIFRRSLQGRRRLAVWQRRVILKTCKPFTELRKTKESLYVLLSNSKAAPGRNFSQPRTKTFSQLCSPSICITIFLGIDLGMLSAHLTCCRSFLSRVWIDGLGFEWRWLRRGFYVHLGLVGGFRYSCTQLGSLRKRWHDCCCAESTIEGKLNYHLLPIKERVSLFEGLPLSLSFSFNLSSNFLKINRELSWNQIP